MAHLISKSFRKLSIVIFLLEIVPTCFSQTIKNIDAELSAMQQTIDKSIKAEALHLNSLVNDVQPTLYFQNNKLIQTEEKGLPVKITTDMYSVNLLYQENPLYKSVELICIKIENIADLQMQLNLNQLKSMVGLKYIYFLSTFNMCLTQSGCESSEIMKMLENSEATNYKILYRTSINE